MIFSLASLRHTIFVVEDASNKILVYTKNKYYEFVEL